jgi:hypothetical protein
MPLPVLRLLAVVSGVLGRDEQVIRVAEVDLHLDCSLGHLAGLL